MRQISECNLKTLLSYHHIYRQKPSHHVHQLLCLVTCGFTHKYNYVKAGDTPSKCDIIIPPIWYVRQVLACVHIYRFPTPNNERLTIIEISISSLFPSHGNFSKRRGAHSRSGGGGGGAVDLEGAMDVDHFPFTLKVLVVSFPTTLPSIETKLWNLVVRALKPCKNVFKHATFV